MTERELLLFHIYKDQVMNKKRLGLLQKNNPDVDFFKLKIAIVNYQLEKYGEELRFVFSVPPATKKDIQKKNENARKRKQQRFQKKEWY